MKRLLTLYGAGTVGGLVNTALLWGLTSAGVFAKLGTTLGAQPSLDALYPRLVWGGAWALVVRLLPMPRLSWIQGALLLALFPTAAQLLYFFPTSGSGWFGLQMGTLTPVIVFALNFVWALTTVMTAGRQ